MNIGEINGGVPLAKTNSGTLTVAGINTYTGGTTVSAGTLNLSGSLTNSMITITGGTFAGDAANTGTLNFNITNNTANLISISGSGVLNLTNLNLSISMTGSATTNEFVVANQNVGSGYVTGAQFYNVILPQGWKLNYSGTASNPGKVVLFRVDGSIFRFY